MTLVLCFSSGTEHKPQLCMSLSSEALGTLWSLTWRYMCRDIVPPPAGMNAKDLKLRKRKCVYCGDVATTTDHFRPVIGRSGYPTGFGPDRWNIVPACLTCNASKGNQDWYTFMTRTTGRAPLARNINPVTNAWRIRRLRTFEEKGTKAAMKWAVHRHFHDIDAMRKALRRALDSHESRVWKMKTKAWRSAKEKTGANLSIERMLTRAQAARTMKLMRSGRLV